MSRMSSQVEMNSYQECKVPALESSILRQSSSSINLPIFISYNAIIYHAPSIQIMSLKNMLIKKCLASLRCRTHLPPCFYFSSHLSKSAQQALLASKIVKEILTANKKIPGQLPLRDLIINLDLKKDGFTIDSEVHDEMMKLFTSGVPINSLVLNQNRINRSRQNNGLYVFCPNYLVTPQMFAILADSGKNRFIRGAYGTCKTVSIALFIRLASIINKFRYEAYYDASNVKNKELKQLLQKNIIQILPKHFYWNVEDETTSLPITQLILNQTHQMLEEHKIHLKNVGPTALLETLNSYYDPTRISRNVVIDQVNIIASNIRNWNRWSESQQLELSQFENKLKQIQVDKRKNAPLSFQKQSEYLKKELSILEEQNIFRNKQEIDKIPYLPYRNLANDLIGRLRQVQTYGQNSIFTSSVNIQESLQKPQNQKQGNSVMSLKLFSNSNETYQKHHIKFQQSLKQEWGRNDFLDFCLFQIQQTMKSINIPKYSCSILKNGFREYKNDNFKIKQYYRFLHIRQVVSQVFKQVGEKTPEIQIDQLKRLCIEKFQDITKKKAIQKIQCFLKKGNESEIHLKKKFFSSLYFSATLFALKQNYLFGMVKLRNRMGSKAPILSEIYSDPQYKQLLPLMPFGKYDQFEEIRHVLFQDRVLFQGQQKWQNIVLIYSPQELSVILERIVLPQNLLSKLKERINSRQ